VTVATHSLALPASGLVPAVQATADAGPGHLEAALAGIAWDDPDAGRNVIRRLRAAIAAMRSENRDLRARLARLETLVQGQ